MNYSVLNKIVADPFHIVIFQFFSEYYDDRISHLFSMQLRGEALMHTIDDLYVNFPPHIDETTARLIEENARRILLPAKKIFVRPGDPVTSILYIKEGRTRHYMISPDGIEKVIYILGKGWFLRERTFVDELGYQAARYSITEIPTELYAIERDQFEVLIQHPEFAKALLRSSCIKGEMLRRHAESIAFDSGKERLMKLLVSLADKTAVDSERWNPLTIQYTQQEMSAIIGVNRVTISRFMTELCNEGQIRVINRKIQVLKGLKIS